MFWKTCKVFLLLTLLTGFLYPLAVTLVARFTMPQQSQGSLVFPDGKLRGSELLAQSFKQDRYFWPRPSAVNYDALASGGSNLGPTSKKLKERIEKEADRLAKIHGVLPNAVPRGMIYASGSGLDPHINLETAYFQLPRVAKARKMSPDQQVLFRDSMERLTEGHRFGISGHRYINVLKLNLLLDRQFPPSET